VRRFTLERFREKAARVRALADAAGRDPAALTLSAVFFVKLTEDERETGRVLGGIAARYGLDASAAERLPLMLVGTAAQLRERLAERVALLDLGYVALSFTAPAALARFAAEVLPAIKT
jgi:alkanesulfonate monooxygenase SsuD/methylene tetrahydromethanopterin reductase-like flavin-dependent oxidoreductase (luciferase family)